MQMTQHFFLKDSFSLCNLMYILDQFKNMSGLTINRNKSEITALGYYKAHPPDISALDLTFSVGPFRVLGIVFSTTLADIVELNYLPKKQKLIDTLKIWSRRFLTPIGKIVILKSLALSQLIFLFSVLPSPPEQFIKDIEKTVFSFIWDNKPDKIKRHTIIGDYAQGGLKMFHLRSVISGLKIAWVKRLLNDYNVGKWKCFFEYYTKELGGNKIWYCNLQAKEKKIETIQNPFIREILKHWCDYTFSEKIVTLNLVRKQTIWHNSFIRIGNELLYKKKWIDQGVFHLQDILTNNNTFLTHESFQIKFNLQCNFLDYFSIVHAIPPEWKNILINNNNQNVQETTSQEEAINMLFKSTKICKLVHKKLVENLFIQPKAEQKWVDILEQNIEWPDIYIIPFKTTIIQRLRYFQYKILHRIIGVNKLLKDTGISSTNNCSLCTSGIETILHLFWECPVTQNFIAKLQTTALDNKIKLTRNMFLFGSMEPISKKKIL